MPAKINDGLTNRQRGYIKHKAKERAAWAEYYKKTKEKDNMRGKIFRLNNPTYKKDYENKRRESDPTYRMLCNARTRIYHVIKENIKLKSFSELLGCTPQEFKEHISKQFRDGMSWDNYGEWHVDHIMPCASFDFSKEADQRTCFNYKNMQPLWKEENLRKNKRVS